MRWAAALCVVLVLANVNMPAIGTPGEDSLIFELPLILNHVPGTLNLVVNLVPEPALEFPGDELPEEYSTVVVDNVHAAGEVVEAQLVVLLQGKDFRSFEPLYVDAELPTLIFEEVPMLDGHRSYRLDLHYANEEYLALPSLLPSNNCADGTVYNWWWSENYDYPGPTFTLRNPLLGFTPYTVDLVSGNWMADFEFKRAGGTQWTYVSEAYGFAVGFRGPTSYNEGGHGAIRFSGTWTNVGNQLGGTPTGSCANTQGHRFYAQSAVAFLADSPLGFHDAALEQGRPAQNCGGQAITAAVKAVMSLTKIGVLAVFIPNQWCVVNWTGISTSPLANQGMGIEMKRIPNDYSQQAGSGYILSQYETAGTFVQTFEVGGYMSGFMRACGNCYGASISRWESQELSLQMEVIVV